MRTMRLITLPILFVLTFNAMGQGQFFDDVYFSTEKNNKTVQSEAINTPSNVTMATTANSNVQVVPTSIQDMDVDMYNRRYSVPD